MRTCIPPSSLRSLFLIVTALCSISSSIRAEDFFLTIGGGYVPEQNQASLEANILFFQRVLREKHQGTRTHDLFFADGFDSAADLQILSDKKPPQLPVTELLARLHRRGGSAPQSVEYRNHQIPDLSGATHPDLIHEAISRIAKHAHTGDRLIVYVTAHGGPGPRDDSRNTTITCWNDKEISVHEFSTWLDELPHDLPVIMIMAQCYCGGFADSIFEEPKGRGKLANHPRIGFFAQQFDLPAAGCRPDIEHDQEFSSYFWGALIGQTRSGTPMPDCDADHNGLVSFDEAFAQAVIVGETIDIPLKSSDELLRQFSRIPDYTFARSTRNRRFSRQRPAPDSNTSADKQKENEPDEKTPPSDSPPDSSPPPNSPDNSKLASMSGPIRALLADVSPATHRIVTQLLRQLDLNPDNTIEQVLDAWRTHRRNAPSFQGRGPGRPGQGGSGRRELLAEIREKWPELGDQKDWSNSALLAPEEQQQLLAEIKQLPAYPRYQERLAARENLSTRMEQHELRGVKFRRLIDTLENIVLAKNLNSLADPDISSRYLAMRKLESSSLSPR